MTEKRDRVTRVLNTKHSESKPKTPEEIKNFIILKMGIFHKLMDRYIAGNENELETFGDSYGRLGNLAWAIEKTEENALSTSPLPDAIIQDIDTSTVEYVLGGDGSSVFAADCLKFSQDELQEPERLINIIKTRFERIVTEGGETFP